MTGNQCSGEKKEEKRTQLAMARNHKKKFAFLTIFLGSSLVILQYWLLQNKVSRDRSLHAAAMNFWITIARRRKHKSDERGLKVILFYTPLFGRSPWPGLTSDYNFTHWNNIACRVQACRITYNKSDLLTSDAVIFHGRDLPSVLHMKQIAKNKPITQRWVYFMHESPKFTFYDPSLYNGFFNWTMSYRTNSDFFVPYRTYTRLGPGESAYRQTDTWNYADGKDKLAVWIVSHCQGLREVFVRKLMKYIKVDVYGSCSRRFNQTETCAKSSPTCHNKLKRYKFIFSFENSYCIDYITEKYWYTPFEHDIVPVVLGGASYDQQIAIPGSFINAMDFPSVQALANYLLLLDSNDSAYNKYFSWRRKFKPVLPESWTCQMCAALNNQSLPTKIYNNIDSLWSEKKACGGENERKIRQLIEQSD